jgi:hypothetical protein
MPKSKKSKIVPISEELKDQERRYFYAFVDGVLRAQKLSNLPDHFTLKVIKERLQSIYQCEKVPEEEQWREKE